MASPFGAGACVVRPCTVADLRQLLVTWPASAAVHDHSAAAALYARRGYTSTGVFAHSEYDYVDDDGVEQHAVECNEYMIMELDPGPSQSFRDREEDSSAAGREGR